MDITGNISANQMNITNFEVGSFTVTEKIEAAEIEIKEISKWKNEVFSKDYDLPLLSEVETYIAEHSHLPGFASGAEVFEKGYNISEMDVRLLQKIEELTLYVIELEKKCSN